VLVYESALVCEGGQAVFERKPAASQSEGGMGGRASRVRAHTNIAASLNSFRTLLVCSLVNEIYPSIALPQLTGAHSGEALARFVRYSQMLLWGKDKESYDDESKATNEEI
jgi:hypothetical protein